MDSRTGDIYKSFNDAVKAGVPPEVIVEVRGTEEAIRRLSENARRGANKKKLRRTARRKVKGFVADRALRRKARRLKALAKRSR